MFSFNISDITDFFVSLLFPKRCVFCRSFLDIDTKICVCPQCEKDVVWISGTVCEK
jgi:predicted amidophosphoribosyltransferase